MSASVLSLNLGAPEPSTAKNVGVTGIGKAPVDAARVRAPGPKHGGLGSGLVGDFLGDTRHHGGDSQAVYAFAREELDWWAAELGRDLPNGMFGENLTTTGLEVSDARLGERWRVGDTVVLQVTGPRIPCGTFRAHIAEAGWLKSFAEVARSGAYLSVVVPGTIRAGDEVTVVHRPDHDVTARLAFRALTRERELLPRLLAAGHDLPDELREMAEAGQTYHLS